MKKSLTYNSAKPDKSLENFIDRFWTIQNSFENGFEAVIVPDVCVDLIFIKNEDDKIRIQLTGLETKPKITLPSKNTQLLSVSFKPLAVEYILQDPIAEIINSRKFLPSDFWNFNACYFNDFSSFCKYVSEQVKARSPANMDDRKCKLFKLLFDTQGMQPVSKLAGSAAWSARQINRYFNHHLGLSLKSYCKILRFAASVPYIKKGILSPQGDYFDQAHFIKEVKTLSGVSPKELCKNQDDRFLQLSIPRFK